MSEPLAWLYQENLYHPSCMVAEVAPPTMAAYVITTSDPDSVQIEKARIALGLMVSAADLGDAWPFPFALENIEDDDSCIACGSLIDPV